MATSKAFLFAGSMKLLAQPSAFPSDATLLTTPEAPYLFQEAAAARRSRAVDHGLASTHRANVQVEVARDLTELTLISQNAADGLAAH